jgi:hypothetical protein
MVGWENNRQQAAYSGGGQHISIPLFKSGIYSTDKWSDAGPPISVFRVSTLMKTELVRARPTTLGQINFALAVRP